MRILFFLLFIFSTVWPLGFPFIGFLPGGISYSTSFSSTQNPISEGGRWTNGGTVGLDWQNVRTTTGSPNKAYGSGLTTGSDYTDDIAILSGFPANQSVQTTVYRDPTYTAPSSHEIELLLRFQISANFARGYEVDFLDLGASVVINRWDGALNNIAFLASSGSGPGGLATGDVVKATMIGNVINVYKNGTLIQTATDNTYGNGNPGMGFFIRTGGTPDRFCISQLTASDLP